MNRNEIINRTIKRLEEAVEIRKGNIKINENQELYKDIIIMENKYKLESMIKTISRLSEEEQRLIGYKYFEDMSYRKISNLLYISHGTVKRRLDKAVLTLGRIFYGMEKEFWSEFNRD